MLPVRLWSMIFAAPHFYWAPGGRAWLGAQVGLLRGRLRGSDSLGPPCHRALVCPRWARLWRLAVRQRKQHGPSHRRIRLRAPGGARCDGQRADHVTAGGRTAAQSGEPSDRVSRTRPRRPDSSATRRVSGTSLRMSLARRNMPLGGRNHDRYRNREPGRPCTWDHAGPGPRPGGPPAASAGLRRSPAAPRSPGIHAARRP